MAVGTYATVPNVKKRLAQQDEWAPVDEVVLQQLCDAINGWIELRTQRVLAPVNAATYLFDASDFSDDGRALRIPHGIRAVTTLRIAQAHGEAFQLVPVDEYLLLPRSQARQPGYPANSIYIHNAGGTASVPRVYSGYGVAEVVGDFGFDAVPPEIRELAETAVVRAWHGRQAGQTDIIGSDEDGAPIVSRFVSAKDRDTLRAYHPYGGAMIA